MTSRPKAGEPGAGRASQCPRFYIDEITDQRYYCQLPAYHAADHEDADGVVWER